MSSILLLLTTYPRPIAALLTLALLACAARSWRWPMALDAALIACYVARPSLQLLVLGSFLAALRWVPPFAAIVAQALRVPEWGGLSMPVALFALPGLQVYVRGPARSMPAPAAELPPVIAATGKTTRLDPAQAPQVHARPLAPAEWMHACNDDPTAPHLGVVGPTRLGKTTFVLALIGRRPGQFVICTPKGADVDPWGGAETVRLGIDLQTQSFDWRPIANAINRVYVEMLSRYATSTATGAERITLIIDELSTTLANTPKETKKQVIEMWNMAAGANINLIVIDPEVNSSAWGIVGRRDIVNNLVFAQVATGRLWSLGRIDPNGRLLDPQSLDTGHLVALAAEAQLAGRGWAGVAVVVSGAPGSAGVPVPPAPQGAPQTHANAQSKSNAEQRIALYMTWRRAGMKSDVARALRHAEGGGLDDVEWAEAGKRLQTPTNGAN